MGFNSREVVISAVRQTEDFLRELNRTSVLQLPREGLIAQNAWKLNRFLHILNLHLTTYAKIKTMDKCQRTPMDVWTCAGTVLIALEQPQVIQQVHDLLSDDKSRECLEWVLRYRTSRALAGALANKVFPPLHSEEDYLKAIDVISKLGILRTLGLSVVLAVDAITNSFAFEQYALDGRVEIEQGDVVLDIGAFVGDTAVWFVGKGAGTVYALEPDPINFRTLLRVIKRTRLSSRIVPINLAVGSQCGNVKFAAGAGAGSAVAQEGAKVDVTTIDRFVENGGLQRVDFIKMDIEGSELEALKGAVETIKKFKPKLAICVYHRPEDLVEIPLFLKELLPDAKFYLSHKHYSWNETVLFVNPRQS